MRKIYFLFLMVFVSLGVWGQTQLAAWTFDATAAAPSTPSSLAANLGTQSGSATIYADGTNGSSTWITATTGNELTAFGGTTVNDPRGTPIAGQSYCPVGGTGFSANGKAMVLKLSMTGYQDPILTYATRNTATGFQTQTWAWSVDNVTYTDFGTVTSITTSFALQTFNLSSVNALDNAGMIYLRIIFTGATNATGNNRVDNIVVNATPTGSSATLANFTPQPTANITQGTNNAVLAGFSVTPTTSVDFTAITVTSAGTATATDISNVRIFSDLNANGLIDGADAAVSGAGIAYAASMPFTISGETGFSAARNYLVVADVAGVGVSTPGNTVTVSSNTFTTTATTNSGSFTGSSRTIVAPPGTTTITAGAGAEPATISSLINTQGAASLNFDFTITDDGATPATDGAASQISQIVLTAGTGNAVTNWTTAIAGVELSDGTNTTTTATIGASSITFASIPNAAGQLGHIADDAAKTYTLKIWLNTNLGTLANTIDGQAFVFRIQTSGVTVAGSQLAAAQDVNSGDGNNTVTVVATALLFVQQPTNTAVNGAMTPAVTVSAVDANGNRDLGFTANIDITSTGTLTGSPVSVAASSGLATFSTLTHTVAGTGLQLSAASAGLTAATSNTFNILEVPAPGEILINAFSPDYGGASDEYVEIVNTTNRAFDLSTIALRYSSTGGSGPTSLGTLSGTIQPYSFWLLSPNTTVTVGLTSLTRDGSFTAGMAAGGGQIGLVRISDNIIIDGAGYGGVTVVTLTEGTASAAPPTDGGLKRNISGLDNNDNSTDFTTVANAAIDLRNSNSRLANTGAVIPGGSYSRMYVTGNSSIAGAVSLNEKIEYEANGILSLGTNNLTLTNTVPSAAVVGNSATRYIATNSSGALIRSVSAAGDYLFPVGSATKYQEATISFAAPLGAPNTLAARFVIGVANPTTGLPLSESGDNINTVSSEGLWEMNAGTPFSDAYTGTFLAKQFMGVIDYTKLHIVKRADASSPWTLDGTHVPTTGSNALATLQRTGMSGFSQFAVGGELGLALPVSFTNVKATEQGAAIKVSWTNLTESDIQNYVVEYATTIGNFVAIGTVAARSNSGGREDYSFIHTTPVSGINYYRIRSTELNSATKYSIVVKVDTRKGQTIVTLYPNPTSGTDLALQATDLAKGRYMITVFAANGQQVAAQTLAHNGGAVTEPVLLPAAMKSGVYTLVLSSAENKIISRFVIK